MPKDRKTKVVVVGSYNTDLVVFCDSLPSEGKSLRGGQFQLSGGGRGANCAVAAARAGSDVTFVGAHGRDSFGTMAKDLLRKEQINLDYFVELPDINTGVGLGMVDSNTGKYLLVAAHSANDLLTPEMVNNARDVIDQSDLVFVQLEIAPAAVWHTLRICERSGVPTVLHASPATVIDALPTNQLLAVVLEDWEALRLTGVKSASDAASKLLRSGCRNVLIIDESRSVFYANYQAMGLEKIPVTEVVDACGSTECLVTWVGLALANKVPLPEAARIGAAAMAYSVARVGGHSGMPFRSELSIGRDLVL
jgi:ribokinase